MEMGILVRHFDKPGISDYLRITVGTPEQIDALVGALKTIWKRGIKRCAQVKSRGKQPKRISA
jgi:hypothetical protein